MIYKEEFYGWLAQEQGKKETAIAEIVAKVESIDEAYNISKEYSFDKCVYLLSLFEYSKEEENIGQEPGHEVAVYGDYYAGTKALKAALKQYIRFLDRTGRSSFAPVEMVPFGKASVPMLGTTTEMAYLGKAVSATGSAVRFAGSFEDFKKYLGAFFKNEVNRIAKPARVRANKICEYCGKRDTLQSAHKEGEERPVIIEKILNNHFKKGTNYYEVDLVEFAKYFEAAHHPVKDHIFFLCLSCHDKYDNKKTITTADLLARRKTVKVVPRKKTAKKSGTVSTVATKSSKSADLTYEMAAYYLTHAESMSSVGTRFLPTPDPNGSKTKSRFKPLGVLGEHKGLLEGSTVDTEILKATGALKTTLEELKARELVD